MLLKQSRPGGGHISLRGPKGSKEGALNVITSELLGSNKIIGGSNPIGT